MRWKALTRCGLWRLRNLASSRVDRAEKKVLDDVARYGWHIVIVMSDATGPGFAYTIGLYESFDHPEIITFGLSQSLLAELLNLVGSDVQAGRPHPAGTRASELLEGVDVTFATFPDAQYRERLGYALWFYGGANFPVVQLFWPDHHGRFPWDEGVDPAARLSQPGWVAVAVRQQ